MSTEVQIALIVATPPTILALVTLVLGLVGNRKLNHITVLTNSTMTAANRRIEELETIIHDLKETS